MKVLCKFINSGTGINEGVFDVNCDAPFLYMGRPAMLVASPFGLAVCSGQLLTAISGSVT